MKTRKRGLNAVAWFNRQSFIHGECMSEPKYREITHRQLQEGYLVLRGNPLTELPIAERHEWSVVRKTDRGTYIVREPQIANDSKGNGNDE